MKVRRRSLKRSEKVLLALCLAMVFTIGNLILWKRYSTRLKTAREAIEKLEGERAANAAAAADEPFWQQRQDWLDSVMPEMGDAGDAQSTLLESIEEGAAERRINTWRPTLLKPEGGSHHHEVSVTLRAGGPDQAVLRWLAEIQAPDRFQYIKYLQLERDSDGPEARMECTLTLARWFRK